MTQLYHSAITQSIEYSKDIPTHPPAMYPPTDTRRNGSPVQNAHDISGCVQYLVDRFAEIGTSEKLRRE